MPSTASSVVPVLPATLLNGPSPEAKRDLIDLPIEYTSGDRVNGKQRFVEHFRRGPDGHAEDTQYRLVSQEDAYVWQNPPETPDAQQFESDRGWGSWGWGGGSWRSDEERAARERSYNSSQSVRPARRDPDNFWGARFN